MCERKGSLRLGFVTENEVMLYMRNALPEGRQRDVEQALLDDERARDMIVARSNLDVQEEPPYALREKLKRSAAACLTCIESYRNAKRGDDAGFDETADIAENLGHRRSLRQQIEGALGRELAPDAGLPNSLVGGQEQPVQTLPRRCDLALLESLADAFNTAISPLWKARIAGWISGMREQLNRQDWLKQRRQN